MGSTIKRASVLPLVTAIVFFVVSLALYLLKYQLANNLYFVLGYLLTPLGITGTMAWDLLSQRRGQQNPNFDVRPTYTTVIKWIVLAGYGVAILHIIELGRLLGQFVVQSGWLQ